VLLLCLCLSACGGGASSNQPGSTPGDAVWRLDSRTGRGESRSRVPGHPCRLAAGAGAAWVTDLDPGALYRVAPAVSRVRLAGRRPCGIAVGSGAVWAGTAGGRIVRVPPGRTLDTGARAGLGDLLVHRGAVWAAALAGDVFRVTARVDRVRGVGETEQLAALGGAVWAIAAGPGDLVRIDARTLAVRRYRIGPSPKALAAGDGAVWVALTDRRLLRFDPVRGRASVAARLPDAPILLAASGGVVWSLPANGRLARVDERSGHVAVARAFGRRPFGLALDGGSLWVGTRGR
jgi:hypothetical protein